MNNTKKDLFKNCLNAFRANRRIKHIFTIETYFGEENDTK